MRWTNKRKINIGDEKIVKRFAFLPTNIGHTTIWLEFYKKHLTYQKHTGWQLRKLSH